jgi:uncharacterized protein YdaU (DUF1376 family)
MSNPYMPLYVGDYMRDTRSLTAEQHGAYLLLLMSMWNAGGSLPADDSKLARFASCTPARWAKIRDEILGFFTLADGRITNRRLARELEKAQKKSITRAEVGSAGGRAKALKDKAASMAKAMPEPQHSSEPEPGKKETKAKALVARPEARATRMPDDWKPKPETWEWGKAELGATDGELQRELARAKDWSASAPASKAAKRDHDAFFRNWLRTAADARKFTGIPTNGALAKPGPARPAAEKADPAAWDDRKWRQAISYSRVVGWNKNDLGPPPGDPGCLAPPSLLKPDDYQHQSAAA